MNINQQVFREYDIRGYVDKDLTEEFAYLLGRAYAGLALANKKNDIAIGYDARPSSRPYAEALARGMNVEGINACLIGLCPTPQLYWVLFNKNFGGGIEVTGSHNPSDMNGFKICLGQKTLSGEEIQDLKKRVLALNETAEPQITRGQLSEMDVTAEYIAALVANTKPNMGPRKLKIVVDAGNGVGALTGSPALKGLGVELIELYCNPDGNFPNHHPDPTELKNLKDLIAKVKETGADFGIGWDGDGDRIGAVDEKGQVIFGDMLVLLYARSILKVQPGATIIGDVKCSSLLFNDIEKRGGKAIMWKTGHSLIKNKLKETKADLAGEMSGHIFFSHRYFGFDDAAYCSCRLAELVSNTDQPVSTLLADLPRMVSTPEIRLDCPEEIKFKVATLAQSAFNEYKVSTIDGVRVEFEKGWGLIRASNTQPVLVMRFEAETEQLLNEYRQIMSNRVEEIKSSLK